MSMPPSTLRRSLGPLIASSPTKLASTSSFSNHAPSVNRNLTSQLMRRNHSKKSRDGGCLEDGGNVKWPLEISPSPENVGASAGPAKEIWPLTSHFETVVRKRKRF